MQALLGFSHAIDVFNRWISRVAVWLVLLAALLSAGNAFFRYGIVELIDLARKHDQLGALQAIIDGYGRNSNSFLEAQWYMFAFTALFGAAYTLKVNEHVRVDLLYGGVSERTRTWIDLFGGIFCLVPFCVVMVYVTWPWFVESWRINEMSTNAGGLPRWPVKLILPVGFGLVLLQGISEIIKCVAALTTDYVREHAYEKPLQ
ncbi:MAG TPA: TRAP transporter small permease subunit [Hyphomicrobiaceae bacterium]|nr:TRAP transporter small permease subunit [Hyphomicrobiaceae bacterium]